MILLSKNLEFGLWNFSFFIEFGKKMRTCRELQTTAIYLRTDEKFWISLFFFTFIYFFFFFYFFVFFYFFGDVIKCVLKTKARASQILQIRFNFFSFFSSNQLLENRFLFSSFGANLTKNLQLVIYSAI